MSKKTTFSQRKNLKKTARARAKAGKITAKGKAKENKYLGKSPKQAHERSMARMKAGHAHSTAKAGIYGGAITGAAALTTESGKERTRIQEAERTEREKARASNPQQGGGLMIVMGSSHAERI